MYKNHTGLIQRDLNNGSVQIYLLEDLVQGNNVRVGWEAFKRLDLAQVIHLIAYV